MFDHKPASRSGKLHNPNIILPCRRKG